MSVFLYQWNKLIQPEGVLFFQWCVLINNTDDSGRYTGSQNIVRQVMRDYCSGGDHTAAADCHTRQDTDIGTDPAVVTDLYR